MSLILQVENELLRAALVFLRTIYDQIKTILQTLLKETLFKTRPDLAQTYSEAITLLVTLTTIYILLTFVVAARKIIMAILILGWVLLILSLILSGI
ncbi:MAG: hypothetical protein HYU39_01035 [Thaumarchaeota archaeon]|nr:hypothetical protein [Nitrososphaerota archaeon]